MTTKCGFLTIIGKPNVGKSSLMNAIIGEKLAIVSPRPQTTRNRITGILTEDNTQLIFLDTPGFHKPLTKLGEHMVNTVSEAIGDVDAAIFVTEAGKKLSSSEEELLEKAFKKKIPIFLVINKIDTVLKEAFISKANELLLKYNFSEVFYTSAISGEGIDELIKTLKASAPESPFYFPEDYYSTDPERFIVSELIREKLLSNLRDEIPHGTAVEIEKMRDREEKEITDIEAVIICEKDSHKGIIIGKGGAMLKKIGSEARSDIENFLGGKCNLKIWVKVRSDWRNKETFIRSMGF
ncbi:MAG: GTPase Era [Oscillospiraceae bacterium]|nr:GTPase Era [Oscillospiraceae bacterium]